jgi:hypothetical protein
MKKLLTTLLFAAGVLAVASVSHAPAASFHADRTLKVECCGDPAPMCPPICDPPPPGGDTPTSR